LAALPHKNNKDYALCILVVIIVLEWFGIVDIPFLDIPDYNSSKEEVIEKTGESLRQRYGD
jgi:hypothetical protein